MFTRTTRGLAALALLAALPACSSGEPEDGPGEEELITQVTLTFTPAGGGAAQTIQITSDADGNNPVPSPARLTLRPGVTYSGAVQFRDTINDEDITREIRDEAEEHSVLYTLTPSTAGTVTVTDTETDYTTDDENGRDLNVGLTFDLAVASGASGDGNMLGILYHFDPEEDAVKTSNTATSDEIDIEFRVPLRFQAEAARR